MKNLFIAILLLTFGTALSGEREGTSYSSSYPAQRGSFCGTQACQSFMHPLRMYNPYTNQCASAGTTCSADQLFYQGFVADTSGRCVQVYKPRVCAYYFRAVDMFNPRTGQCTQAATSCNVENLISLGFVQDQTGYCMRSKPVKCPYCMPRQEDRRQERVCPMVVDLPMTRVVNPRTRQCETVNNSCRLDGLLQRGYRHAGKNECQTVVIR